MLYARGRGRGGGQGGYARPCGGAYAQVATGADGSTGSTASHESDLIGRISAMLQEKTSALTHRLDQEASIRQLEDRKHCQEALMLSDKVAALSEEIATLRCSTRNQGAILSDKVASLSEEIAALRCSSRTQENDIIALQTKVHGLETEIAAKEEAGDMEVRCTAMVKVELEAARVENVGLREQLALSRILCPTLEETDLIGPIGKRIRLACPGVQAERLDIQPLANGVLINILPDVDEGTNDDPLFSKEFVYQCSGGFFQISDTECGIEDGVLIIVLRFVPRPKLKLGFVNRAPLYRIDEEMRESSEALQAPMPFALSPAPSLGTLTIVSSADLNPIYNNTQRAAPNLGPHTSRSISSWVNAKPDSGDDLNAWDSETSEFSLVQSLGARSNSSDRSTDSWISVSGPNCFTADSLFKMEAPGAVVLLPARDLAKGCRVVAADGNTILEVIKVTMHRTGHLVHLKAGEAELAVTGNHRMMVPASSGGDFPPCHVTASTLQVGDSVLCQTEYGMNVMELTEIFDMMSKEQQDVYEITFNPDDPVAVFQAPSSMILSKGFKKRKVHRGRNRGRTVHGMETMSVPDTAAGEYSE